MNWIAALLAGFFSGAAGSLGLGGGGVLIIYLTVFAGTAQLNAQGINLIFFLPCAALAVFIYWRKKLLNLRIILLCAAFGLAGAFLGSYLASLIGSDLLSKLFGGALVLLGCKEIFFRPKGSKNQKNS